MTHLTPLRIEQNKRIARLYLRLLNQGMTYDQVAHKYKITKSAVHQFMLKYGQ